MDFVRSSLIGFFFGVFFGAGCALAVMYSIYSGGYRRAVADSLRPEKSDRFRRWLPYAEKKLATERSKASSSGSID